MTDRLTICSTDEKCSILESVSVYSITLPYILDLQQLAFSIHHGKQLAEKSKTSNPIYQDWRWLAWGKLEQISFAQKKDSTYCSPEGEAKQYLGRIVKQPVFPCLFLISHHSLCHLMPYSSPHAVQQTVQPAFHLEKKVEKYICGHLQWIFLWKYHIYFSGNIYIW